MSLIATFNDVLVTLVNSEHVAQSSLFLKRMRPDKALTSRFTQLLFQGSSPDADPILPLPAGYGRIKSIYAVEYDVPLPKRERKAGLLLLGANRNLYLYTDDHPLFLNVEIGRAHV